MLRSDINTILRWVTQGSRVLDLGCGSGELAATTPQIEHTAALGNPPENGVDVTAQHHGAILFIQAPTKAMYSLSSSRKPSCPASDSMSA